MKRILFPTDYSETANNAFKYALQWADKENAQLFVLHVYDPPVISGHISPTLVDGVHDRYNFNELEKIEEQSSTLKAIQKELNCPHVKVLLKVKPGDLITEIKKTIKEHQIDQIVMGTDGSSSFQKKLLGTNTLKTISKVEVPVLSVPREAVYKELKNILYLTRFSPKEEKSLEALIKEAKEKNYTVICTHLRQTGYAYSERYHKWEEKYKDDPVTFTIYAGGKSIYEGISEYIKKRTIDMVAIAHQPRSFFDRLFTNSITINLGKRLAVPLLVYQKKT